MAVSKRIQVLLKPRLNELVEALAEKEHETISRMTAILVTEALTARGVNKPLTNYLPPDIEDSMRRELTAVDRGWKPSEGLQELEDKTPEWSEPEYASGLVPEVKEVLSQELTQQGQFAPPEGLDVLKERRAKDPEWFATPEGLDVLNQRLLKDPEWSESPIISKAVSSIPNNEEALQKTQSTDARMLKLKLMQDLIDQLKSL